MSGFDELGRPIACKVGPFDFSIKWEGVDGFRAIEARGMCDTTLLVIRIYADMPPTRLAACFLHELIHALHAASPLANRHTDIEEEQMADLCSLGLVAFWRDNPSIFSWWSGLIKGDGL